MKIFAQTYGCSFNQSDSETMLGLLKEAGHEIVDTMDEADVIIQNTCTVKGPTESRFYTKLEKLRKLGKHLVIAGCIAQTDPQALKPFSTIGTDCVEDIVEVVEETAKGHIVRMAKRKNSPRLDLPRVRVNPFVEIVPICKGCLGSCTYCKTVHARGRLFSFTPEAIVERVREAVAQGAKEIWLTSQDNSAYGKDIGTDLPTLISMVTAVEGDFMVRVGMANPDHFPPILKDTIEAFQHPKVFKFLHIPVQCGSNKVLRDMKREYTVEQYTEIVNAFKKEIPEITVSTDIIVAFPDETEEEFEDTITLIEETTPNVFNLSRFWPRPGTPAARMKQIQGRVSKARSKKTMEALTRVAKKENEKWIGWEGPITITEPGKNGSYTGRNHAYKPIIVQHDGKRDLLGKTIHVRIEEVTAIDFRAKILIPPIVVE